MKIHEYQAKELLAGVRRRRAARQRRLHARGGARRPPSELGGPVWVVKAQIHAGGRGKGGGVKLAKAPDEAQRARRADARHDAGHPPDRPGGPDGPARSTSRRAATSPGALPRHRRSTAPPRASTVHGLDRGRHGDRGGRRQARPRRSSSEAIDPASASSRSRPASSPSASASRASRSARPSQFMPALYQRLRRDATPRWSRSTRWSSPSDGDVLALDAKMNFDDNALFRHKDLAELRDLDEEDPLEVEASRVRPQLHQARRQHRLHGQRRRPRDGHDGHHQARTAASRPTSSTSAAAPRKEQVTDAFSYPARDPNVKACWSTSSAASCAAT